MLFRTRSQVFEYPIDSAVQPDSDVVWLIFWFRRRPPILVAVLIGDKYGTATSVPAGLNVG